MKRRQPDDFVPPPKDCEIGVVESAFTALALGRASEDQQKRAVSYLLGEVCWLSTPEEAEISAEKAAFTRGLRHVGMVVARLSNVKLWGTATHDGPDRPDSNTD